MVSIELTPEEVEVLLWGLGWGLCETAEHPRTPVAKALEEKLEPYLDEDGRFLHGIEGEPQ